jgi:hypothetical protein
MKKGNLDEGGKMTRYLGHCTACLLIAILSATPAIASTLSFSGTVFFDLNDSGSRVAGDPGLPGQSVNLLSGGSLLATTTTDANGNYSFFNVDAGTYMLALQPLRSPWKETFPSGGVYTVTSSTSGLDFGLSQHASVPEPSSLMLLGTGVLGLCGVLRRKLSL